MLLGLGLNYAMREVTSQPASYQTRNCPYLRDSFCSKCKIAYSRSRSSMLSFPGVDVIVRYTRTTWPGPRTPSWSPKTRFDPSPTAGSSRGPSVEMCRSTGHGAGGCVSVGLRLTRNSPTINMSVYPFCYSAASIYVLHNCIAGWIYLNT